MLNNVSSFFEFEEAKVKSAILSYFTQVIEKFENGCQQKNLGEQFERILESS